MPLRPPLAGQRPRHPSGLTLSEHALAIAAAAGAARRGRPAWRPALVRAPRGLAAAAKADVPLKPCLAIPSRHLCPAGRATLFPPCTAGRRARRAASQCGATRPGPGHGGRFGSERPRRRALLHGPHCLRVTFRITSSEPPASSLLPTCYTVWTRHGRTTRRIHARRRRPRPGGPRAAARIPAVAPCFLRLAGAAPARRSAAPCPIIPATPVSHNTAPPPAPGEHPRP